MALSLVAAASVVLFAGRLTSLDAFAVSNVDKLKSEIIETKRRLTKLYTQSNLYTQIASARSGGDTKEIERLERSLAFVRDDTAPPDLTSIRAMIESEVDQLSKQNELLLQAWNKELSSEHGYNDWRYITATATRVGVVLIIVYLVQIMMGLYGYNTRLIAYYNSRRDLLALWDGSIKSLKPLDEIMATYRVDFGKEPKHPLEICLKR
jgi:hypothetical protein